MLGKSGRDSREPGMMSSTGRSCMEQVVSLSLFPPTGLGPLASHKAVDGDRSCENKPGNLLCNYVCAT